jgi:L-alanine-DL-glutamate epimerase-like enolase superfamily enzyme
MRIREVEVGTVEVPLVGTFATAHSTRTSQRSVLVRVAAESGESGWGSVEPTKGYSRASIDDVAAAVRSAAGPAVVGADALNPRAAREAMRGRCAVAEARAVVESALFDLAGRLLGVAAWRLLGGRVRERVRLNGWIGLVPPARAATEAAEWAARGFTSAKVKVGHDLDDDVARVRAIREAVGPRFRIRMDANEGMDVERAVALGRALEPCDLELFEQPIDRKDFDGLAAIRRRIGIPIMADESVEGPESVIELIRREAADFVKVKVMKQGGLLDTIETVDVAAAAGLRVVIGHGFGLWPSTMAEAVVAAACPAIVDGIEAVGPLKMRGDVVGDPPAGGGRARAGDGPGLGVRPDPARLAAFGWTSTTVR